MICRETRNKKIISIFLLVLYICTISFYGILHTHGHSASRYIHQSTTFQTDKGKVFSAPENCLSCVFSQTNIGTVPIDFSYEFINAETTLYKELFFQNPYCYTFDEATSSRGPPAFL